MGKKEYYTVKEYAEIKGVSVQAIYKKLNTTLQPYVEIIEGRKVLRSEALSDFPSSKSSTVENDSTSTFSTRSSTFSEKGYPSSQTEFEELKRKMKKDEELIDDLRSQIKEKDSLLKSQTEQILDLSKRMADITENNQKLQLSYQLLLNGNEGEVETFTAREQEEVIKEEPKKKGLFSNLFKR